MTAADLRGMKPSPRISISVNFNHSIAEQVRLAIMPGMIDGNSLAQIRENRKKSLQLAALLFPDETWVYKEPNIYVAKSRLVEEYLEKEKWEREMSQVRILTSRGSVAYFLPEKTTEGKAGIRCADTVIDGEIVELKTVSGTRATLSKDFKKGYKQVRP
jgi:hypothetical protein